MYAPTIYQSGAQQYSSRWIQLFATTCLLDCIVMEMLHVIFPSSPLLGKICFHQDWPRKFLFGSDTGLFKVNTSLKYMKMLEQEKENYTRFKDLDTRTLCERIPRVSDLILAERPHQQPMKERSSSSSVPIEASRAGNAGIGDASFTQSYSV